MIQKRTILFLVRLYHPHIGGVEKHVLEVSELLKQDGFRLTIITELFDKRLPLVENFDGIKIYRIPIGENESLKKLLVWKWVFFHLPLFLKSDIIHIHDVFYWILPFRLILIFKRIYITFHGYEGYPVKMSWIVQRKLAEFLTKGSICVGDFMKKWYFARPTSVIYGGVRLVSKNDVKNANSAVFFGRLDDQTGILEYIKAYNIIRKKYPDFKFTIVGEGKLARSVPKSIELLPFTSKIEKLISENRFIFVSRYLSMLEALVQKKEIISTYNSPIMKDYLLMSPFRKYISIGKTGEEIADTVIKSLSGKNYNERIEKGYKWAKKQTWKRIKESYLSLWGL